MNRRGFMGGLIATAAGLYLPCEPQRIYSFASSRYLRQQALIKMMQEKNIIGSDFDIIDSQLQEMRLWNSADFDKAFELTHFVNDYETLITKPYRMYGIYFRNIPTSNKDMHFSWSHPVIDSRGYVAGFNVATHVIVPVSMPMPGLAIAPPEVKC